MMAHIDAVARDLHALENSATGATGSSDVDGADADGGRDGSDPVGAANKSPTWATKMLWLATIKAPT